jgi:hypothetical protein
MSHITLQTWERDFRRAAKADHYDILRDHMKFLELDGNPVRMVEATILMVHAMAAYYRIDGRSCDEFLAMQSYNPSRLPSSVYVFTFDLCGYAYGRLLADPKSHTIDLADLFNHPWQPYRAAGYFNIRISHTDWSDITKAEAEFLDEQVTDDLRFDYSEDEVGFWCDDSHPKYLYVDVYDIDESDDEDKE